MTKDYKPIELIPLGRKLYGYVPWENEEDNNNNNNNSSKRKRMSPEEIPKKVKTSSPPRNDNNNNTNNNNNNSNNDDPITEILNSTSIEFFKRYGFVVVPSVIPRSITTDLRDEIKSFLLNKGNTILLIVLSVLP